jgi:hypothetical protein
MSETTRAYGPVEVVDDTRQAQMQVANDAPVDVNPNAIIARDQALITQTLGHSFQANQDRRDKIADIALGRLAIPTP